MNALTTEQMDLASRLSKHKEVASLLMSDETEWKAVVLFQNFMEADDCMRYISKLDRMGVTTGNATIDQRIEAFIQTMLKRI